MPVTPETADIVTSFQALPRDRQAALLARMTPDQKQKLNAALDAHLAGPSSMLAGKKAAINSDLEKAIPGSFVAADPNDPSKTVLQQPGTLASRAREAAIGVLEPFTAQSVLGTAKRAGSALWQMGTGGGTQQAQDLIEGAVTAPVQPVKNFIEGLSTGNYDTAAYGAGGMLSQTAPAIDAVASGVRAAVPGDFRNAAMEFSQNRIGSNALKATEPIVRNYNVAAAKLPEAQAAADAATAESNRLAQEGAARKTSEIQAKATNKNAMAEHQADIDTEATRAKAVADNQRIQQAHQQAVADANAHNAGVRGMQTRAQTLDSNLKEGSEQLGNDVVDLGKKLREEGNSKYAEVRKKLGDDPGVPLADMADSAREAEGMLKGSPENIRQFRDLVRKGAEEEGAVVNGQQVVPGDPLYEMLKSQGALDTGGTLPFDQLQGYSSEIGRKLAQGNLPSDVYQAMKFLKEKIDAAKTAVAERNGAGSELKDADKFWNKYQDAFYDKDSAVAGVRGRVGVLDPEFYSEPFTKGKAAGVGSAKLRELPTQYSGQASSIADAADRLRAYYAERKGMKIPAEKPVPTAPNLRSQPPRTMGVLQPIPEPVVAEPIPGETVAPPVAPTAEQIMAAKQNKVLARAQSIGELHRGTAFEFLSLPMKSLLSNILKRPGMVEWLTRPTADDLTAIDKLPDPVKAQLRTKLQQVIDQQSGSGNPVQPAPSVLRVLARTANVAGAVQNRRDAREALGKPTP